MSTKTLIPAGDDDPGPDPYALRSASAAGVPVAPMLSMFDPIYLGIDEFGHPVYITLIFRNLLAGGEPGGGAPGGRRRAVPAGQLLGEQRLDHLGGVPALGLGGGQHLGGDPAQVRQAQTAGERLQVVGQGRCSDGDGHRPSTAQAAVPACRLWSSEALETSPGLAIA